MDRACVRWRLANNVIVASCLFNTFAAGIAGALIGGFIMYWAFKFAPR